MALDEAPAHPLAAARVASATPGRVRLRLPVAAASQELLVAATDALAARPEVARVQARWRTGSLVVEFDPRATEAAWGALSELGLARLAAPVEAPETADAEAARVLGTLGVVNALVARHTGGTDLRTLVPVGLGLLALRQLVRGEQRLADAPWYVLAWYASETFQKFHAQRRGE